VCNLFLCKVEKLSIVLPSLTVTGSLISLSIVFCCHIRVSRPLMILESREFMEFIVLKSPEICICHLSGNHVGDTGVNPDRSFEIFTVKDSCNFTGQISRSLVPSGSCRNSGSTPSELVFHLTCRRLYSVIEDARSVGDFFAHSAC